MEIGRIPEIDQAKINHNEKVQKVQESDKDNKITPDDDYKDVKKEKNIELNEVILSNVQFGYNTETEDFFVKVKKGNTEFKYPSDEMMKMKSQMKELLKKELEE